MPKSMLQKWKTNRVKYAAVKRKKRIDNSLANQRTKNKRTEETEKKLDKFNSEKSMKIHSSNFRTVHMLLQQAGMRRRRRTSVIAQVTR